MTFKPTTHTAESGHWYSAEGIQVQTVTGSKGQQVKPDLRHARKFGFAPGVTSIIKVAHKEQLVQYRERQVLLASLTLPQIPGESQEDWIKRIMVDAKTHAIEAAERGSEIHAHIEAEINQPNSTNPWVLAVLNALYELHVGMWSTEVPCVHKYGYGTKSDLHYRGTSVDLDTGDVRNMHLVLDIKTKDGDLNDVALYAEHYQQLAATAHALNMPNARCGIVFVSRTEPIAKLLMADPADIEQGWNVFKALLNYWQIVNKHKPEWAVSIY